MYYFSTHKKGIACMVFCTACNLCNLVCAEFGVSEKVFKFTHGNGYSVLFKNTAEIGTSFETKNLIGDCADKKFYELGLISFMAKYGAFVGCDFNKNGDDKLFKKFYFSLDMHLFDDIQIPGFFGEHGKNSIKAYLSDQFSLDNIGIDWFIAKFANKITNDSRLGIDLKYGSSDFSNVKDSKRLKLFVKYYMKNVEIKSVDFADELRFSGGIEFFSQEGLFFNKLLRKKNDENKSEYRFPITPAFEESLDDKRCGSFFVPGVNVCVEYCKNNYFGNILFSIFPFMKCDSSEMNRKKRLRFCLIFDFSAKKKIFDILENIKAKTCVGFDEYLSYYFFDSFLGSDNKYEKFLDDKNNVKGENLTFARPRLVNLSVDADLNLMPVIKKCENLRFIQSFLTKVGFKIEWIWNFTMRYGWMDNTKNGTKINIETRTGSDKTCKNLYGKFNITPVEIGFNDSVSNKNLKFIKDLHLIVLPIELSWIPKIQNTIKDNKLSTEKSEFKWKLKIIEGDWYFKYGLKFIGSILGMNNDFCKKNPIKDFISVGVRWDIMRFLNEK